MNKNYLIFRVVFIVFTLLLYSSYILNMVWQDYEIAEPLNTWIVALVLPPYVFMFFNLLVFKFNYGIFGRFKRTSIPAEAPLIKDIHSYGVAGFLSASVPFFTWSVYPSGLGINILLIGRGFIPIEKIIKVQKINVILCDLYRIKHNSPEIRNPVIMPSKKLFDTLQGLVSKRVESSG